MNKGTPVSCYEVLGAPRDASIQEIKRCFRKKAKLLHPDLNRMKPIRAAEEFRLLIEAYEVLSNLEKREEYDRTLGEKPEAFGFDYRMFLKRRKNDMVSQSRLILHDLLRGRQDEALELFEALSKRANFQLEVHLPREDMMDCFFLLAEAYENRGNLRKSFALYKIIYKMELEAPYFKHFMAEIVARLRNLTCGQMIRTYGPGETLPFLREAIDLNISRRDNAFFHKKMAEIHVDLGAWEEAQRCLELGLTLDPRLPGIKKLKDRIRISKGSMRTRPNP
jgi:curved DNA-binding protein CbpA